MHISRAIITSFFVFAYPYPTGIVACNALINICMTKVNANLVTIVRWTKNNNLIVKLKDIQVLLWAYLTREIIKKRNINPFCIPRLFSLFDIIWFCESNEKE